MKPGKKLLLVFGPFCGLLITLLWMWSVGKAAPLPAPLSAQTLSSPTTISNSSNDTTRPVIAVGSSNSLYVAWEQEGETGGKKDIFQSSNSGPGWSTPAAVYASSADSWRPSMTAGPDGDIHIIWKEETGSSVYTTVYQKGLTPTTLITISPVITQATAHDIVVDNDNVAHLGQQGNKSATSNMPYNILHSQGAITATVVYTTDLGTGFQNPSITADGQGNLHLVWQKNTLASDGELYYSKGITSSGVISWIAATPVPTNSVVITDTARPSMAVDSNNTLHLVWEDYVSVLEQYIYYIHSTGNVTQATPTTWSTPIRIMSQAAKANNTTPSFVSPVVAVFSNTIYAAWHDIGDDTLEDIYYTSSTDGGTTWATPVNVSNSSAVQSLYPQIAVDGQGTVHFVWQECKTAGETCTGSNIHKIQYARTLAGGVFLPLIIKSS